MVAALLAAVVSDTQQEGTQASDDPQVVLSSRLAMDVGCGTGLSGAAVCRHCRGRLVGCDLSTRMLGVAATKRREAACGDDKGGLLYDALDCCDAAAFLLRAAASSADRSWRARSSATVTSWTAPRRAPLRAARALCLLGGARNGWRGRVPSTGGRVD